MSERYSASLEAVARTGGAMEDAGNVTSGAGEGTGGAGEGMLTGAASVELTCNRNSEKTFNHIIKIIFIWN